MRKGRKEERKVEKRSEKRIEEKGVTEEGRRKEEIN